MSSPVMKFNNYMFNNFIQDFEDVFPDNVDIATAKDALMTLRRANPKLIPVIWKTYIVSKYINVIQRGNIQEFVEIDYLSDIQQMTDNTAVVSKIIEAVNRFKEPIKQMNEEDQRKTMMNIQMLTKLSLNCQ